METMDVEHDPARRRPGRRARRRDRRRVARGLDHVQHGRLEHLIAEHEARAGRASGARMTDDHDHDATAHRVGRADRDARARRVARRDRRSGRASTAGSSGARGCPRGASGFAYHSPVLTILMIFIVLSAIEIPIIDLIVHPWPWVRIPLLILGIWGVTWMIGLAARASSPVRTPSVRTASARDRRRDRRRPAVGGRGAVERSRDVAEKAPKIRDERARAHARRCACRTRPTSSSCSRRPVRTRLSATDRRDSTRCGCGSTTSTAS